MTDAVNSVRVYSIDEEKLKFRVILCVAGRQVAQDKGTYIFQLPPLTSFGNSDHYDNALIQLDAFEAHIQSLVINDQTWFVDIAAAMTQVKLGSLEVRLDTPSSQTLLNFESQAATNRVGNIHQGGFRALVPVKAVVVGKGTGRLGFEPPVATGVGNTTQQPMGDRSFQGVGSGDAIMCANPFGATLTVMNRHPANEAFPTFLGSQAAGAAAIDEGTYSYQFTITMIPRRE